MEKQEQPKLPSLRHCPFLKQQCIGVRCHLWTDFTITQPASITGMVRVIKGKNCVFNVIPLLMAGLERRGKDEAE